MAALEIIAVHPVLGLDVPDNRLDRGAAFHSQRIGRVTRRTWPVIETRNFCLWLWARQLLSTWMRRVSTPVSASSSLMTGPGV
jgi:hypothetical protein